MKFGEQLKQKLFQDWKFYYLDYDGLKRLLKERTADPKNFFAEQDEAAFVEAMEKEVEKVCDFRDVKAGELTRHVQHCENIVANIDFESITDEELLQVEAEIGKITYQLSQLANFTRLNYTGFVKILKKHDKHTAFMLKPMFMVRLNTKPLFIDNLDTMIYRLSKLYDVLRAEAAGVAPVPGGKSAKSPLTTDHGQQQAQQSFVRKTTKYWVHPDNVTELKCLILKYLPVLIFNLKNVDPSISSVYFDNDQMDLYKGRLQKLENAQAIRFRWYGSQPPYEVFVERKTHKEDWTGETSVKQRFLIKEKHLDEYIEGEYSMQKQIQKLKEGGAPEKETEELELLSREVQETIKEMKLKPKVRTFYRRTAFQLPGDARVRISLDTDLAMIKEDGLTKGKWRRSDVESDYPFGFLPSDQICHFPYAILEVKLQTLVDQEAPKWVQDMVNGHLVEAVPKFSKFVHGCAVLLKDKVHLEPFWLPQMHIDIRKPVQKLDESAFYPEHHQIASRGSRSMSQIFANPTGTPSRTDGSTADSDDIVIDIDEANEEDRAPLLGRHLHTRGQRGTGQQISSRTPKLPGIFCCFKPNRRFMEWRKPNKPAQPASRKKIAIPVRVEPKVFFANERTFLSWLHFSILLGGISSALVGLGNESAKLSGYIFSSVSVLFAVYALYLYQWRARKIRLREAGPYDDRLGPIILVVVFLGAISASVVFGVNQ